MTTTEIPTDFTGTVFDGGNGNFVRRSVLPGGVRVLTEAMPTQRSVSIGFWIAVGSRDESPEGHGATHFLEHLLFKGTPSRGAMDIASAFDRVGGEANAATAKESTCYHARVLDEDLPMAIKVISDMVTSAVLDPEEMDTERGVILEELAMDADDPADVAHELLAARLLDEHPLGRPIGGTAETINGVTRDHVVDHYRHWYRPDELVVTAAGGLDHHEVVRMVTDELQRAGWLDGVTSDVPAPRRCSTEQKPGLVPGLVHTTRPVEQASVMVGGRGLHTLDEDRFALTVMNTALGGGMSSRLFQEVRERRGLAYTTFAFAAGYSDAGYYGLYAGCQPSRAEMVAEVMVAELDAMATDTISAEELERAQGQIRGTLVLGLEDTGSRMSRLGRAELVTGEYTDLDGALERISNVDAGQVQSVAARLADSDRSTVIVGPDHQG